MAYEPLESYFDLEPDPEVLENPSFKEELNRRLEEIVLQTLPLEEYDETVSC